MISIILKRISIILSLLIFISNSLIGGETGKLTPSDIQSFKNSLKIDGQTKALMNAISNNDVKQLAFNRELYNKTDHLFNFEIDVKGITDQASSGRCWMFAGFNMMRPEVIKKFNLKEFEFSQNYIFFWHKLELANQFLENIIATADRDINDRELQVLFNLGIGDGGWWNSMVNIVEKYGAVPKDVMPETKNSSKTGAMNTIINDLMMHSVEKIRMLVNAGKSSNEIVKYKLDVLKDVYRLLVLHLGEPPSEFTWRYQNKDNKIIGKQYTPLDFYKEVGGVDLKEYVSIFDHPAHPYNKYYQMNFSNNTAGESNMSFINLEISKLKELALKSVLNGDPVWFATDVGKENDKENGVLAIGVYDYKSLYSVDTELSKRSRVLYRKSVPNHAMLFVGVDTIATGEVKKWRVENSWGTSPGNKGYWTMYQDWFDAYVFNVIIHKKYLPKEVLDLLETEPTNLPAWDPFYEAFN